MSYMGKWASNREKSREKNIDYNHMNDKTFTQLRHDQIGIYNRGPLEFQTYVEEQMFVNKAGYTATEVACGWAGAIFEVTRPFGQQH